MKIDRDARLMAGIAILVSMFTLIAVEFGWVG